MSLFPYFLSEPRTVNAFRCESPLGFVPGMISQQATQVLRGQNMEHKNGGLVKIMIFLFNQVILGSMYNMYMFQGVIPR